MKLIRHQAKCPKCYSTSLIHFNGEPEKPLTGVYKYVCRLCGFKDWEDKFYGGIDDKALQNLFEAF